MPDFGQSLPLKKEKAREHVKRASERAADRYIPNSFEQAYSLVRAGIEAQAYKADTTQTVNATTFPFVYAVMTLRGIGALAAANAILSQQLERDQRLARLWVISTKALDGIKASNSVANLRVVVQTFDDEITTFRGLA